MATPPATHQYLASYLNTRTDPSCLDVDGESLPAELRATLAAELRQKLAAYAAYIPSRLVSYQLAHPEPGRVSGAFWQGSLLFADLSGFTSLSAHLSTLGKQGAEEVSAVVNQLFDALVDEVMTYQGTLLKFGGDALTAFFDSETLGEHHASAATLAALAMQERMNAFAALKTRKGTFQLQLRVGVHSGKVFAAEVGDTSHMELVITGTEVNRVATAQEIAAPGEVVISDYTAALLDNATLAPRKAGFQHITTLPDRDLPSCPISPIRMNGPDDPGTLEMLAAQVAAIQPYLVRNLPGRFLDANVFEIGEFRPVTVLFANFHDFSAILTTLERENDAQRAARVLNAYFQRAQSLVHRYDGIVNKVDMYTHGDKLMALFGAPNAHEDDPLRAVRCALEMRDSLDTVNAEIAELLGDDAYALQQRIGVNTGTVFAGRVGGARRYEYTVMGSAVNLSARLMAATPDTTIQLSPATRTAVEHQIAVVERPPLSLKGLPEPVVPAHALHALEGTRTPARPSDTSISRPPLVGRDTMLALLKQEATSALCGEGRVLALVGEAGIGKTRLTEELIQQLVLANVACATPGDSSSTQSTQSTQPTQVPCFQLISNDCQSYEQSMPYVTIRPVLRQLLGVRGNVNGQPDPDAATRMEQRVARYAPERVRFIPLLGDVLGIDLPETPLTEALSTEQRHDRVQELIVALLVGAAQQEPLLLSLEDIQWADASSLELLGHLSQVAATAPMLLLFNYRPEPPIAEPWRELPATTRLQLDELVQEDSAALLAGILNGSPPQEVLLLLERTQGNPLFIEELVRALIDSESLARDEAGGWVLTRPLDQVTVPGSIEGLIYARLDRLDEELYELVQTASVIGRRFAQSILSGIVPLPSRIPPLLQRLIEADIVIAEDHGHEQHAEQTYLFRHALLRDVAYDGILYARRRELHCRVAQRFEQHYFGYLSEYLTLVGKHYLLAEEWMVAYAYHKLAGIQAQQRYANREALSLYGTALEVLPTIEQMLHEQQEIEDPFAAPYFTCCLLSPLDMHRAELCERSGYLHARMGEGEQAEQDYQDALRLVERLLAHQDTWNLAPPLHTLTDDGLSHSAVRLHRHLATLHEQQASYGKAFDWLERGMRQITHVSRDELARCYLLGARIYYVQGAFDESLDWAEMGLAVADYLENIPDQAQAFLRMGNIWKEKGELSQSIVSLEQACTLFEQVNHLVGLNNALNDLGVAYYYVMRRQDAVNCYARSLDISESVGDVMAQARTSMNMALVLVEQDELERANQLYEASNVQFRQVGSDLGVALTGINRATVLLLQKQPQEALHLLHEATEILERINARIDLPETLRLSAEAALDLGNVEQAIAYANQSLAIARELGMTLEEGVALRVLGQIALCQGDVLTARPSLEQSISLLEQLDNRLEYGKVLHWLARLTCEEGATGAFAQTEALLDQAESVFQEIDAQRDLAEIRACRAEILRRAGDVPSG